MNDSPYTTPDEDPFNIQPLLQQPTRRRSSMLNKWIQEQQTQPPTPSTPPATDKHVPKTHVHPYLAYPDLNPDRTPPADDIITLNSYDIVDDEDIPQNIPGEVDVPLTPITVRSRRTSKLLQTPTSFRNFNISFRSASSAVSDDGSPRPSRLSFFPRSPRRNAGAGSGRNTPKEHNRSSSLSTINVARQSPCPVTSNPVSSTKWRPSVLGHFSASSTSQTSIIPSDTVYTPSRPSVSSGDTYPSATTPTTDCDLPLTPPKFAFMNSIRSRNGSQGSVFKHGTDAISSSSVWSQNQATDIAPSNLLEPSKSAMASDTTSALARKINTRIPLAPKPTLSLASSNIDYGDEDRDEDEVEIVAKPAKYNSALPHVVYAPDGPHPRVNFASLSSRNQKKKKKLVVSGVGRNDARKFEGVKQWCESFGEVSQIMRMPNGDLHVHFRLAEVADTVCRIRARVYISGVGSVQLSWYTGDKR